MDKQTLLLNGDEAVAWAALDAGVNLGAGYPGTPSTEILEKFAELGGNAQWSPNEKVALEVSIGAAFGHGRVITTMKHVGLNVAADPLFTATYTGVDGGLVVIVADDPGMASSQNEQDSRRYAIASGAPILEPCDAQQAYDCLEKAFLVSEKWHIPVILRLTTRVSHSKSLVTRRPLAQAAKAPYYVKDASRHVMVPGNARPAHVRLRAKLDEIRAWAAADGNGVLARPAAASDGTKIVASGISTVLAQEAAPAAALLQVLMVHPFPAEAVRAFAAGGAVRIVEEGDPVLFEQCRLAGVDAEANAPIYRFGELSVSRVRRLLDRIAEPETPPPPGKPPALCPGCPHRSAYQVLADRKAIVSGDIGCYTLGVMPPYSAVDTTVCMGGGITVGLGLRKVLPPEEAKRVVSVIGDSTFVHSGLTGIAEMVYNPPPTGHVVVILDNSITAMTGMQENPATGRNLKHAPTYKMVLEDVVKAMGVPNVHVVDHVAHPEQFNALLDEAQEKGGLWCIIVRRSCLIAAPKIRQYDEANAAGQPIMPPPEKPWTRGATAPHHKIARGATGLLDLRLVKMAEQCSANRPVYPPWSSAYRFPRHSQIAASASLPAYLSRLLSRKSRSPYPMASASSLFPAKSSLPADGARSGATSLAQTPSPAAWRFPTARNWWPPSSGTSTTLKPTHPMPNAAPRCFPRPSAAPEPRLRRCGTSSPRRKANSPA